LKADPTTSGAFSTIVKVVLVVASILAIFMFTDVVLEVLATVPAITKDFAVAVKTSVNELLVIADEVSEKLLAIYYSPPKAIANANPAAFN
jgi:hypothetical protein